MFDVKCLKEKTWKINRKDAKNSAVSISGMGERVQAEGI
jgi:hypothetical protein